MPDLDMNLVCEVNMEIEYKMTLPENLGILKYDGKKIILLLNKNVEVLICDENE